MYTKGSSPFILSSNIISEITQAYPRFIQLLRQSLFYPKGPQKEQLQRLSEVDQSNFRQSRKKKFQKKTEKQSCHQNRRVAKKGGQ